RLVPGRLARERQLLHSLRVPQLRGCLGSSALSSDRPRRTKVWRGVTSPARGPKRLRSRSPNQWVSVRHARLISGEAEPAARRNLGTPPPTASPFTGRRCRSRPIENFVTGILRSIPFSRSNLLPQRLRYWLNNLVKPLFLQLRKPTYRCLQHARL